MLPLILPGQVHVREDLRVGTKRKDYALTASVMVVLGALVTFAACISARNPNQDTEIAKVPMCSGIF